MSDRDRDIGTTRAETEEEALARELRLFHQQRAERRWIDLLPTRNLARVVFLLFMLVGVVYFQRRAGRVASALGRALFPMSAAPAPRSREPSR